MTGGVNHKIFINYRRGDDPGFTTALYMHLEEKFGRNSLFMDVEGHIKPGDDFVEVLQNQVSQCEVLLVVIGPRWTDLLAARLGDVDDFVAVEIEAALNQRKKVIPFWSEARYSRMLRLCLIESADWLAKTRWI